MQLSRMLKDNGIVDDVLGSHPDPIVAETFLRCLGNTLDTTVRPMPDRTNFVVTGDIPAMWLRDSTTQLLPYLVLMPESVPLQDALFGVLRRQLAYIEIDPYANAFNAEPNSAAHDSNDLSDDPWVWERKYEVDSLAFPINLAYRLWRSTGRTEHFDATFVRVARRVLEVWRVEQDHETASAYRFVRTDCPPSDTLVRDGRGSRVSRTGMTWSGFRPSDDACAFGYNIPANLFAATVLRQVSAIAREVLHDELLAVEADRLRDELRAGVEEHGTVRHPRWGTIYAYEVDGMGNRLLMDDANMPSLLSTPLFDDELDDDVYRATRAFALSDDNPYFYRGRAACGIGSPHTPHGFIWPIALAVQGLTSHSPQEKRAMLELLCETDAGTGLMHESFDKDDAARYTRPWFSWANAMFCLLVLDAHGHPLPPG